MEQYEAFKEASGWYLAAWRDKAGLTLDELAAEMKTSKGFLSDLETGAIDKDGKQRRFNRGWVERVVAALHESTGVTGGYLIDVNPFEMDERLEQVTSIYRRLEDRDRDELFRTAGLLARRSGA